MGLFGVEKLFELWQNISDSRTPHLFQIQWWLSQMEFLSVQVVLVLSLSFVNLPGVHSLLGLGAAHCCSESWDWPMCWCFSSNSFVQLRYSWLHLRQLSSWFWFSVHVELHYWFRECCFDFHSPAVNYLQGRAASKSCSCSREQEKGIGAGSVQ